jgi:hypothetical protein
MNWYIWIFATAAFIGENSYFGWNMVPKSDAEMIADLIVLAIFAIAFSGGRK